MYRDALREFDRARSIDIFSAGHDEVANLGDTMGVVYKPSGAGGGDCGIAFATETSRLEAFRDVVASQGFVPLDVQRDNRGV